MGRRGERDRAKEWYWRRLLRQWRRSGASVRDFCGEHRLSEPCFYAWRRTIVDRDREAAALRRRSGSGREARLEGPDGQRRSGTPAFVPVRLLPTPAVLEVVLERGCVVRVPVGFDAATLRQLLAVLGAEAAAC